MRYRNTHFFPVSKFCVLDCNEINQCTMIKRLIEISFQEFS